MKAGVLLTALAQALKASGGRSRPCRWTAGCLSRSPAAPGRSRARTGAFPWQRRAGHSSRLIIRSVGQSRHGVLSLNSTCPAALSGTRWSDSAGRVMYRHPCAEWARGRRAYRQYGSVGLAWQCFADSRHRPSSPEKRLRRWLPQQYVHWPIPSTSMPGHVPADANVPSFKADESI